MARISNLDFYAILGVHPSAEDIVIRAAFKALAQRYHPDRYTGSKEEAHRRMADLTNAYETLADPARRRKYDRRRGLTARRATFYFKNPARDRQPFGALAARAAARKARHYRTAVYVLMVVVMVLSGFNIHQHAAQIKELFAWGRPSSTPIVVATPIGTATAPAPAASEAAPSSAPPPATTANVRILPIGPGSTRPIGTSVLQPPASAPQPVDPAPAVAPPAPANGMKTPAPPAAADVTPTPTTPAASVSKAPPRTATVEPHKATVTGTAAPSPADAPRKDAKRATPKAVVAKTAEPDRPAASDQSPARPAAADSERCSPELVALGLCGRSSTSKE